MSFPTTKPIVSVQQMRRIKQQNITPKEVNPASLSQTTLQNTQAEILGPVELLNGGNISITSILTHNVNPEFRLGGVPYNIVFFEDDLNTDNIIGGPISGYTINGPFGMPQFTPEAFVNPDTGNNVLGGNDGDNLVFLTEIINDTGDTHDIYIITDTRVYTPVAGSIA